MQIQSHDLWLTLKHDNMQPNWLIRTIQQNVQIAILRRRVFKSVSFDALVYFKKATSIHQDIILRHCVTWWQLKGLVKLFVSIEKVKYYHSSVVKKISGLWTVDDEFELLYINWIIENHNLYLKLLVCMSIWLLMHHANFYIQVIFCCL